MKVNKYFLYTIFLILVGCHDLNLNPLSEGSSENWYTNETEFEMALNDLFREVFWERDNDLWTDDLSFRGEINAMVGGTVSSENAVIGRIWLNSYKAISRSIQILENIEDARGVIGDQRLEKYEANARFVRASMYSRLINRYGDVPFYTESISLDEAYEMGREDKYTILQLIYEDYDYAAATLPQNYTSSELVYATKGAALAMKARIALYMEDFETARDAARETMELGEYELHPDYRTLFLSSTKNPNESIFAIPRSYDLGSYETDNRFYITRLAGGFGSRNPTYSLFSTYLSVDGLPIDESPLYDPQNPFENRDPRLTEVFVEHQTEWLGFIFQPHPDSLQVLNTQTGQYVNNLDTRANVIHAPFNGLVMKKGIDESYSDGRAEPDLIIIRYADVLLMYAEAKIELNEIDQTVLDAINSVRARAYKVDKNDINSYPAVITNNQGELRKTIRFERRMELPFEGLRYSDLIRWRIAEKALTQPSYGLLEVSALRNRVVNEGLWFFPGIPEIDDNAIADFTAIESQGLIQVFGIRDFNANRQYLWPIPASEILINPNMTQNPGY